jgi:hypothetical protein
MISKYEREQLVGLQDLKLRKIKNWLTLLAFSLIFIGLQGLLPLPQLETLFLLWTGNLCILWVSWVDNDKRLFILTLMMMIAQLSRVGL